MIDFQPADVGYLQRAFSDAIEEARRRSELNMPTSAATYEDQARNVKKLRDKILSTMDAKVRASYSDYEPPQEEHTPISGTSPSALDYPATGPLNLTQ